MWHAVGLLNLQATIWALLTVGVADGDANVAITLPSKVTTTAFVAVLLALAAGTSTPMKPHDPRLRT
jgi:hypothetical protein